MAGQNIMSEHAAVRNESHQETFWSSLNDSFNFSFYNYICLGSLVLFWQILLKVSTNSRSARLELMMYYITEAGKMELIATESSGTYFHHLSLY